MPQFLSTEAQSLLRALFKRNPANRLGKSIFYFLDVPDAGWAPLTPPWVSSVLGQGPWVLPAGFSVTSGSAASLCSLGAQHYRTCGGSCRVWARWGRGDQAPPLLLHHRLECEYQQEQISAPLSTSDTALAAGMAPVPIHSNNLSKTKILCVTVSFLGCLSPH